MKLSQTWKRYLHKRISFRILKLDSQRFFVILQHYSRLETIVALFLLNFTVYLSELLRYSVLAI